MSNDYIGRCKECGSVVMWMSEESTPKEVGKFAQEVSKGGLSLERMDTETARKEIKPHRGGCSYGKG